MGKYHISREHDIACAEKALEVLESIPQMVKNGAFTRVNPQEKKNEAEERYKNMCLDQMRFTEGPYSGNEDADAIARDAVNTNTQNRPISRGFIEIALGETARTNGVISRELSEKVDQAQRRASIAIIRHICDHELSGNMPPPDFDLIERRFNELNTRSRGYQQHDATSASFEISWKDIYPEEFDQIKETNNIDDQQTEALLTRNIAAKFLTAAKKFTVSVLMETIGQDKDSTSSLRQYIADYKFATELTSKDLETMDKTDMLISLAAQREK